MERMAHQSELCHGLQDGEDGTSVSAVARPTRWRGWHISFSCGTAYKMERMTHQSEPWHGLQNGEDSTSE